MVAGSECVIRYDYLVGRVSSNLHLAVFQRHFLSSLLNDDDYLFWQFGLIALRRLHVIELKALEVEIGNSCAVYASGSDRCWASAARAGFCVVGHLFTGEEMKTVRSCKGTL